MEWMDKEWNGMEWNGRKDGRNTLGQVSGHGPCGVALLGPSTLRDAKPR